MAENQKLGPLVDPSKILNEFKSEELPPRPAGYAALRGLRQKQIDDKIAEAIAAGHPVYHPDASNPDRRDAPSHGFMGANTKAVKVGPGTEPDFRTDEQKRASNKARESAERSPARNGQDPGEYSSAETTYRDNYVVDYETGEILAGRGQDRERVAEAFAKCLSYATNAVGAPVVFKLEPELEDSSYGPITADMILPFITNFGIFNEDEWFKKYNYKITTSIPPDCDPYYEALSPQEKTVKKIAELEAKNIPGGLRKTKSGLLIPTDSFSINADNREYFDYIFSVDSEQDVSVSHADLDNFKPKVLQSFSIIPIAVQEEDLQETELGKQLYESSIDLIRQLVWKDYDSSDESNMWLSDPQRAFAEEKPVVQKYGADPQNLVTELLDQPVVKTLSKYALSTTNLLNFAVLQEAVFPYNKDFDLNDIFARSKQVINQISSNSREDKNDWSSPLTPEVMAGWENEMDRAMSAQIPEGAYYSWLNTVLPKWILRTYLKSSDPCMRDAFRQQDIYGYDDKKLPEIVFGSLFTNPTACADLSNVLGGLEGLSGAGIPLPDLDLRGDSEERCLPGIRPVPIFPPGPPPFGFFGNPFKPITAPGLTYIAMQFLTGFEDKYSNSNENIEEQKSDFETGQANLQNKSPYETDVCAPDSILKQDEPLVIDEAELGE